jgi:hypothetical protein
VQKPYRPGTIDPRSLYSSTGLNVLDGMPFEDYRKYFQGRIKQATDHKRRDMRLIGAGTTVLKNRYGFFATPVGSPEKSLDGGVTIDPKDGRFTNMVEGNRMEAGSILIVESIQCQAALSSRDFNAFALDEPTDLAPAAAGTMSASNTLLGLNRNTYLEFDVGRDRKAEGRLASFPSDEAFSGAFGGDSDEGFIQIGYGKPRNLKEIVVLAGLRHFTLFVDFFANTIVPQNVEIEIALCGVILESVG